MLARWVRGKCLWQVGFAHEKAVAFASGASAFIDGPDDKALATAAITGGEDVGEAGLEPAMLGVDVGTGVTLDGEGIQQGLLRPEETHGEENKLGRIDFFGSRHILWDKPALVILLPRDLNGVNPWT